MHSHECRYARKIRQRALIIPETIYLDVDNNVIIKLNWTSHLTEMVRFHVKDKIININ